MPSGSNDCTVFFNDKSTVNGGKFLDRFVSVVSSAAPAGSIKRDAQRLLGDHDLLLAFGSSAVADLDAVLAKVTENGGKVKQPRGPIPGVGWYAAFVDPTGNAFGLMQADTAAR